MARVSRLNRERRLVRWVLVASLIASVGALGGDAHASKGYGYTLISAGYVRGCAACHDDAADQGGLGTANKPFAATMKRLGLTGNGDDDFFRQILDERLQDYDTDCDGVIDLDELTKNGDVNDPAVVPTGYTAAFVAGCNDDNTTAAPVSTNTSSSNPSASPVSTNTSSSNSSASPDDGDGGGSESTGCALAPAGSQRYFELAAALALLGLMLARRGTRLD